MNAYWRAAEKIRRDGLHKGGFCPDIDFMEPDSPVCAMGALNLVRTGKANGVGSDAQPLSGVLDDPLLAGIVRDQFGDRISEALHHSIVPAFNDHPATTEDDVVAMLEKAAVAADELIATEGEAA